MDPLERFTSLQDDVAQAQELSLCSVGRMVFLEIKAWDGDTVCALLLAGRD